MTSMRSYRKEGASRDIYQKSKNRHEKGSLAKLFQKLMSKGKVNQALRYHSSDSSGGVLSLNTIIPDSSGPCTVREILVEKHPKGKPASSDTPGIPAYASYPVLTTSMQMQLACLVLMSMPKEDFAVHSILLPKTCLQPLQLWGGTFVLPVSTQII